MLKKICIKNFLSCEDTEIEFDNVTVLIGRNAAGKSNILKSIEWAYDRISKDAQCEPSGEGSEISFELVIENKVFNYIFNISNESFITESFSLDEKIIAQRWGEKAIYSEKEFKINSSISFIKAIITFFPENEINYFVRKVFKYCNGIGYYTLGYNYYIDDDETQSIKEYEHWLGDKNDYKDDKTDNSVLMRLFHLWKEDKETFDELQEILGINGLDLVSEINIETFKNNFSIEFFVKYSSFVAYSELSYGTQRVLMILLALLYDKNSILLIEQPEDGIHIGLLRKVLSICFTYSEAYNKQLIITTHSPEVIDMFKPENMRIVRMTEQGTKVNKLDDTLLAILPEYLENEGLLSDFIESMDDE